MRTELLDWKGGSVTVCGCRGVWGGGVGKSNSLSKMEDVVGVGLCDLVQ